MTLSSQIIYPDSDGQPMADNTQQFRWIVLIKENLEVLFADNPDVFVAGDLLWYPVEGQPKIRIAPDAMVIFGRPKGDRGSYRQWEENNIVPQVVFEILSPGNRPQEMAKKQQFYDNYGVEEYYIYDPDRNNLNGLRRVGDRLQVIEEMNNWTSPRLGIRFVLTPETLELYRPDNRKFLTTQELEQRAEEFQQQAQQERLRAEQERERAERLAAQLRELGIDPDA
ncbi:MAG: Uma2 family endonuclease [Jaaginema sp. PMC 1080.18]|nr:Uma2 family endonuclease [Jaaginema sp. PMC 1080.18]MEC4867735.1 Uma2 family endonuclease [Jaaginema sp. PMC 1078.18]